MHIKVHLPTNMDTDCGLLFVYGTLLRGFNNDFAKKLHENSKFVSKATFSGKLFAISWYPGAVYNVHDTDYVYGEVYSMQKIVETLKDLDEYEEVSEDARTSMYIRQIVPVTLENGDTLNCWTYLYNQPTEGLERIESGDFRKFN